MDFAHLRIIATLLSGLALLATIFKDDVERTRANGIAFSGLSVGIIGKDIYGVILLLHYVLEIVLSYCFLCRKYSYWFC